MSKTKRSWQEAGAKIVERCNSNDQHNVIPVNACVGSGKTDLASYAIGDFIIKNKESKTFQMFVTPRIRLCAQQADEIRAYLKEELGLEDGRDYDIMRKDCTQHDMDLKAKSFSSRHAVAVVCDESLWGTESDGTELRWRRWMQFLDKLAERGWKLGNIVLDEAHNYTSSRDKVLGEDIV